MTTSTATPGLHLRGIRLTVDDGGTRRTILDDVDLDVAPGEFVGLTGPSGSGKSTLLAVAGCLQAPDSGTALLTGADGTSVDLAAAGATGPMAAAIRRDRIGLVFQQPNLSPALTAAEQLIAMTRLGRVLPPGRTERRAARRRAEELLAAVGLEGMGGRHVGDLSGGQQARVNLARALMNDPDLLLVDEPTAALDAENAARITGLISQVTRDTGTATLYVTHDVSQLDAADRVVHMVDGLLCVA